MARLLRLFGKQRTSVKFDINTAQVVLWMIGMIVLIGGVYELAELNLTEYEFLVGLLLLVGVSLQIIIAGFLLPIGIDIAQRRKKERADESR